MTKKPTTQFNAGIFRIVETVASTEATRYYLNGVYIEPSGDGVIMVATDGHRMLVARDPEGSAEEPVIIHLSKDALRLCKHKTPAERKRTIMLDGKGVTVYSHPLDKPALAIGMDHDVIVDGTFPEWRRVVPYGLKNAKTKEFPAFSCQYLGHFTDLGSDIAAAFGIGTPVINLRFADATSPALIMWSGCSDIFGVLMPMRNGNVTFPSWIGPAPPPPPEEPT